MHKVTQTSLETNFSKLEDYLFCHRDAVEILCDDGRRLAVLSAEDYARMRDGLEEARPLRRAARPRSLWRRDRNYAEERRIRAGESGRRLTRVHGKRTAPAASSIDVRKGIFKWSLDTTRRDM